MTRRPRLALAALWLVLGAVMAVWVALDRRPPEWDHASHLGRALHCQAILARPDRALGEILDLSSFYPPLATCATGLAYFLLPVTPLTAQLVMWAFLGLALASVFALGRRLWDAGTGLLAAFFLGTAPFVVFSLTNFQLDLPLTGMVALALAVLARSEALARPGSTIALGAVLGLGMLTKPTFAVYLAPALCWAVVSALAGRDRARLGRIAGALVIAAALALPWYGPRLIALPMQVADRSFTYAATEGHARVLTADGLLFYPRVFVPQFGALAAIALIVGAGALWRRARGAWILWAGVIAPFALIALIQNKNLRYSLPILAAAALVAAAGVRALSPGWGRAAVWACVVVGALQTSVAAFAVPVRPPHVAPFGIQAVFSHAPLRGDWQHGRILADLVRASGGRPATVAVVPNYNFLSTSTLRYEAERRGLPVTFTRGWDAVPFGVDFAVVKTGSQGPSFTAERPERIMRDFAADPYLAAAYPVVAEYPLPDGSLAALRVRRLAPLDGEAAAIAERITREPAPLLARWVRDPVGLAARLDYDPDALRAGRIRRFALEAESALVGEVERRDRPLLRVRDVRVAIDDCLFDARRLMETGALAPLDAGAVRIERLTLHEDDLREFLRAQRRGAGIAVAFGEGVADVRITRAGPRIAARVRAGVPADGRPFALAVEDVRIGAVHVPDAVAEWVTRHFDPTLRLKRLPVETSVGPVQIRPGRLEIGASP